MAGSATDARAQRTRRGQAAVRRARWARRGTARHGQSRTSWDGRCGVVERGAGDGTWRLLHLDGCALPAPAPRLRCQHRAVRRAACGRQPAAASDAHTARPRGAPAAPPRRARAWLCALRAPDAPAACCGQRGKYWSVRLIRVTDCSFKASSHPSSLTPDVQRRAPLRHRHDAWTRARGSAPRRA
jgi:hypothetical protein